MGEHRVVVKGVSISFSGLFEAKKLWEVINNWYDEQGFDKNETVHEEICEADHKQIYVKFMPYRKISDYARMNHTMFINISDLKKKTIEVGGHKRTIDEGKVSITIEGYLVTDYDGRWEGKAEHYFIRTMIDKFIFAPYNAQYQSLLKTHIADIRQKIKTYLNLKQYN